MGGNVECTAWCFASIRDTDFDTLELAFCVTEHCLPRPFYAQNYTEVSELFSESTTSPNQPSAPVSNHDSNVRNVGSLTLTPDSPSTPLRPDCTSVLLQFAQQIKFVREPKIHVSKYIWIGINLNIAPYSAEGSQWLEDIRKVLKAQSEEDGFEYYLTGGDVPGHDTVSKVFDLFPVVIGIIVTVVFTITGFIFRSVLVPIRAVFTICLTLIFIYGVGVLVYERHVLDFTGFRGFSNPGGDALSWLTTSMLTPISVGLSLDYDIFLLTRIHEYRTAGFNDHDSIMCGLSQTGRVITAAGMVMSFAFGGLIFSSNATLNEIAFFLVCCVLVDTFVVRTIVVPAVMVLLGTYNWWPSKPKNISY